jgi:hypothetical protein
LLPLEDQCVGLLKLGDRYCVSATNRHCIGDKVCSTAFGHFPVLFIKLSSDPLLVYSFLFPSALAFAHLLLAAAESLALTAGLLRQSFLAGLKSVAPVPLILAHLARCADAILALTAADLRRFLGASSAAGVGILPSPAMESISPSSFSICSLMAMIWRSWVVVKFDMLVMGHW